MDWEWARSTEGDEERGRERPKRQDSIVAQTKENGVELVQPVGQPTEKGDAVK